MLLDYLPERYKNSPEMLAIQSALDIQAEKAQTAVLDFLNQLNVDTATWGLELWERQYGIPVNMSESLDVRRSTIKAKMRGTGTVTKDMIKNVAESYANGAVEVFDDNARYTIVIQFISEYGTPERLEAVKRALEEIKPAHLALEYLFKYLLIRDIHDTMTIAELETMTLNKFAFGGEN